MHHLCVAVLIVTHVISIYVVSNSFQADLDQSNARVHEYTSTTTQSTLIVSSMVFVVCVEPNYEHLDNRCVYSV